MNVLDKLREKGLNLSKETHPNKTYQTHVEECREVVKRIAEVYSFSEELTKLALLLCDLHDVGKLLSAWSISQKRRPLHSIEGTEWFMRTKEDIGLDISQKYQELLPYMIASHHSPLYVPIKFIDVINKAEEIRNRSFEKYFKCKELARRINGLLRSLSRDMRHNIADILGIVKMADLISAKGLSGSEVLANYLRLEELEEDRLRERIVERACSKRRSFDQRKFELQKEIASLEEEHLLVAAPTGWGKTALALLRVAFKKPVKVFYILPTITAIKDLYDSLTKIVGEKYVGEYFYFADVELLRKGHVDEEDYLLDMYRYFIPKVTITTIDQLLLTTLQVGKYYLRRFNLRNSLIVVDEFHLLTPEMIACTRVFLRNLRDYNISCLFMSATPSPVYEELLKEVLPQMRTIVLDNEYKRLKRHEIVYVGDQTVEEFASNKEELLRSTRTLVLVNTVSEAQRLYKILKNQISDRKIVLIHGDFAYKDRAEKEEQIDNADILVSTQVAEVSLDVSFDLLITELAPIPSLIQRFGRVNRYAVTAPKVNVYVCKPTTNAPYGYMMSGAGEILQALIKNVKQSGEAAYLSREFWQYEQLYKEKIKEVEEQISKKIESEDSLFDFFSMLVEEEEVSRFLGREETILAMPEVYLDDALGLLKKLKRAVKFEDRMAIYAKIKECLAPASRSDIKTRAEWNDELKVWVIKNYSRDLGVIRLRG